MADLSSKSTDGRISFQKYVTDNKRFSENYGYSCNRQRSWPGIWAKIH